LADVPAASDDIVAPLVALSLLAGADIVAPLPDAPDGAWADGACWPLPLVCAKAGMPAVSSAARATPLSSCFMTKSFLRGGD
jgi:hypothetical protein